MPTRTFVLLILVLVAAAGAVALYFLVGPGSEQESAETPAVEVPEDADESSSEELDLPTPTATPAVQTVEVVVALVDLPVGQRLRPDLIETQVRPNTNVAVQAGVTFSDEELVIGKIVKTPISKGQEILAPMLALNPSDVASIGSDLSIYVDQGEVAVAFPIDRFNAAAYAMRPGDQVDAFMSMSVVNIDEEFQTQLPNVVERVNETALLEGQSFLFPETSEGRLELIPGINAVALIAPGEGKEPVPRRVTQLTIQQMEVLWVGSWRNPNSAMRQEFNSNAIREEDLIRTQNRIESGALPPKEDPRREVEPDTVIMSMSSQDALSLKWALENGLDIDLVLRGQGDNSVFVTTSVSLPQLFTQGLLVDPEDNEFSVQPRIEAVPTPGLPPAPPG
jgi:Flp pilus assembly protein CpaB